MRSNGEGDAVSGCCAGADTLAGETIDHVQRVLQLHEDVRAQFFIVEEKLTTAAAERMLISADTTRKRRAEVIDKLAATLILQGALDRLRNARF